MKWVRLCIFLSSFLLSACSANFLSLDVKPSNAPMYNMTQSSGVLACVGRHINDVNAAPIDIFIADIPDHTTPSIEGGFLTKNAVMMVTTAVDRIGSLKVEIVGRNGAREGRRQVQILGAWTELNRTSSSDALKGKGSLPGGFKLDFGNDESLNHIALDMAMAENNRIIPMTATSVSIQVNTKSGNSTITYDNGGSFAAVAALGFSAQEGFHSAERLLVETAVALMVSRYFGIDLRDCLQLSDRVKEKKDIDQQIFSDPAVKTERSSYVSGPSFLDKTRSGLLTMETNTLPLQGEEVIVIPGPGKTKKYLPEAPEEYVTTPGDFSGSSTTSNRW